MSVAIAPHVTLAGDEQTRLESHVRPPSTPQTLAYRCRVILRAAAPDHPSHLQVASELPCNRHTVGRWRSRDLEQGLSGLQDAPRPGRPRRFSPSQRLDVMSMATRKPATYYCPATRWGLDDWVRALHHGRLWAMSRSSIWRILEEADLKPHRSVYWLNSHNPDFESKAHDLCSLYLNALRFFEQGRMVICSDEKTGMQILQRQYPTQPIEPGKPAKREHESIRHGTRALIASFGGTYAGQPLVRATPFSQTRRQQRQGRAWFSPRPKRFERALYPPRPYKRVAA